MSAPAIPIPVEVQVFGEISANKATVSDLRATTLAVSGATSTGAITAPSVTATTVTAPTINSAIVTASTKVETPYVRTSGTLFLESDANFIQCNSDLVPQGPETIGAGGRPWAQALITTVDSTTVNATTVNATTVNTTTANAQTAVLSGAANTGRLTTPSGKQLVVAANGQTESGLGPSANMQFIGNACYMYDGLTAGDPSLKVESNRVTVDREARFRDNLQVGIGGAVAKGVVYAATGKELVLSANGQTGSGVQSAGSIKILGNQVFMNDGIAAEDNISMAGGLTRIPYQIYDKFGFGSLYTGFLAGVNGGADSIVTFNCTANGSQACWSAYTPGVAGGFDLLGSGQSALTGFRVLDEGFYEISFGGKPSAASGYLDLMLNGAPSFRTPDTIGECMQAMTVTTHLSNPTEVTLVQRASGFINAGLFLQVKRIERHGVCRVIQNGVDTTFNNQ